MTPRLRQHGLREALSIDLPILGAPMARIAGGRLTGAVSRRPPTPALNLALKGSRGLRAGARGARPRPDAAGTMSLDGDQQLHASLVLDFHIV